MLAPFENIQAFKLRKKYATRFEPYELDDDEGTYLYAFINEKNVMVPVILSREEQARQYYEITGLISDMNERGCTHAELLRAICHAFVIRDAWKYHLDYTASARDHGISDLMKKYSRKDK